MENKFENLASENEEFENLASENEENDTEGQSEDVNALKEKIKDISGKNRQLFERVKKAEGFEKDAEGKWVKTQKPKVKPEPKPEPKPQSNEPDYAKLAFLEQRGFAHPDDQKLVQDEAERLKLPLTDVLGMEHIKSKLQTAKDTREALAGMPKGRGKVGGLGMQDVDYWLAKGETPDDLELAEKVINARINKEKNQNKFSDTLYIG